MFVFCKRGFINDHYQIQADAVKLIQPMERMGSLVEIYKMIHNNDIPGKIRNMMEQEYFMPKSEI